MNKRFWDRRAEQVALALLLALALCGVPTQVKAAQNLRGMSEEEARARIPVRNLPEFWVGDVAGLGTRLESLQIGQVQVIGVTPGHRPLYLVSYGEAEPAPSAANFNSAVGARLPSAYIDRNTRTRPVILFIGPVHGHEVEGLTGLMNLIQIMETGQDLRGRDHSTLQSLGRRCRLLILPSGNPDGTSRFVPRSLQGMTEDDVRFWGQGTWSDGTFCNWPQVKRLHPIRRDQTNFMGCYFNDAGVNPMHDEFLAPMSSEAPAILQVARSEGPEIAVSLHSHESRPALLRPAYVPLEVQGIVRQLALTCYAMLEARQLPHGGPFDVAAEGGEHPAPYNLTSAVYHISGAASFTFECPHGVVSPSSCQVGFDQILDVQLVLYQSMMEFALEQKAASRKAAETAVR